MESKEMDLSREARTNHLKGIPRLRWETRKVPNGMNAEKAGIDILDLNGTKFSLLLVKFKA
jgi:hypothetical protein